MDLKLYLHLDLENGVKKLQISRDSMNVIKRVKNEQLCSNYFLIPLLEEVKSILCLLTLHHIYKKRNKDIDALSKEGLQMPMRHWFIL